MLDRNRLPDPATFYEAEGLTLKGKGKWLTARCPLHGGESLRINTQTGAFACMGGCDFSGADVIAYLMKRDGAPFPIACEKLGAWTPNEHDRADLHRRAAQRIPAGQLLQLLRDETMIVYVIASDIRNGKQISPDDWDRLAQAVKRIHAVPTT